MLNALVGLIALLGLFFFGTSLIYRITRSEPYICSPGRFFAACAQVPLHIARAHLDPSVFHSILIITWTLLAIISYEYWMKDRQRFRLYQATQPVEAEPPVSPVARLEEIRLEKAKLDLEERELEKRPDAHRL